MAKTKTNFLSYFREAIVYALFARYLKRIAAHLANILTTVINPFHLVGYGFEDNKKEEIE